MALLLALLRSLEACVPADSMSIWWSTNMSLTGIQRYAPGWHNALASTCIAPNPLLVAESSGALVWSHHSASIRRGSFGSGKERVQKIDDFVHNYAASTDLLFRRLRSIRLSKKSRAFVHVFPRRDTSIGRALFSEYRPLIRNRLLMGCKCNKPARSTPSCRRYARAHYLISVNGFRQELRYIWLHSRLDSTRPIALRC